MADLVAQALGKLLGALNPFELKRQLYLRLILGKYKLSTVAHALTLAALYGVYKRYERIPVPQIPSRAQPIFRVPPVKDVLEEARKAPYDVVICGAGWAGNAQARHLLINSPGLRIALIDPSPEERTSEHLKVGESLVEVSSMFLGRELGLFDYMIENHGVKFGLNYHWPKNTAKTDSLDDYHSVWNIKNLEMLSFQIDRAKIETDLLRMNKEMGVHFFRGRVTDLELTRAEELKTVQVKMADGKQVTIAGRHLVDAAGRAFLIGNKTNNILRGPEHVENIKTGASWIRLQNYDRLIFHSGYNPDQNLGAMWYGTNHYCSDGNWSWSIPISPGVVSIGVVHHRDLIPSQSVNTLDKLLAFYKANHRILYDLIMSGEVLDHHYLADLAYDSKLLFSPDNWYVIGDAALFYSPFYSAGLTITSNMIQSVTAVILESLYGCKIKTEEMRVAYEKHVRGYATVFRTLYTDHDVFLGNASIMSWRLYFEFLGYAAFTLPADGSRWFWDYKHYLPNSVPFQHLFANFFHPMVRRTLLLAQDKGMNLGMLDPYRPEQLTRHATLDLSAEWVADGQFEPRRYNVWKCLSAGSFNMAYFWWVLVNKVHGLSGFTDPEKLKMLLILIAVGLDTKLESLLFWFKNDRVLPLNQGFHEKQQEFKREYRYVPGLQPW